jgi:hypothetical protein
MNEYHLGAISLDSCRPEYQQSEGGVGGISSLPLTALRQAILIASIAVAGTIPVPIADTDSPYEGIEATFVFPSSSEVATEDQYSRIREEIIASGIPMLDDEELRHEIRERKGGDSEDL